MEGGAPVAASQVTRNPLSAINSNPAPQGAQSPRSPAIGILRAGSRRALPGVGSDTTVSAKGVPIVSQGVMSGFLGVSSSSAVDKPGSSLAPEAVDLAVQFVRDALTGRNPNTRLARAAGVAGAAASPPASRLELLLRHRAYRALLVATSLIHCLLAFFENIPPSAATPPFSWAVGACEAACIAVYCIDQAIVLWALGYRYYLDKRWEAAFGAVTVLCLLDWLLYYPGALRGMFRFSRPLRPLLGIAKRTSLRRLLSSMVWTIPALVDVSLLLGVTICFFAVLGMQLFNRCEGGGVMSCGAPFTRMSCVVCRGQVAGYSTANDHFDDWISSSLAIYVLSTTENYPNVGEGAASARHAGAHVWRM